MNKLDTKKWVQILVILVKGKSINSTCRMSGALKNTVFKLLADVGHACSAQDRVMRDLKCLKTQCDEIWSFVGMKENNEPDEIKGKLGFDDVYTWTAIDADTKLIRCWHVGTRDAASADAFIRDLTSRLANRIQLTTDGHGTYIQAVENHIATARFFGVFNAECKAASIWR